MIDPHQAVENAIAKGREVVGLQPLFPSRPDPRILCRGCHQSRQVDEVNVKPGEIPYLPCVTCGDVGIYRERDLHQRFQTKKANTAPYDRSPYRGGKLPPAGNNTGLTEA